MNGSKGETGLKFEPDLGYQKEAIAAAAGVFSGNGNVALVPMSSDVGELFTGNANELTIGDEDIRENVRRIQSAHGLATSDDAVIDELKFSLMMETGTGKTYVYLRTIFELNKRYGWTKFIVVVPSIAIKEGVASSIRLMTDHLKGLYGNVPFDWFVYRSDELSRVRAFAMNSTLQIMVINIDAFRKDENVFNRVNDKLGGRSPADYVTSCNPVIVIDEPQSVDGTEKSKEALKRLGGLCQFRYSATHRKDDLGCLIYSLDSIDAYNRKLVKEIEVVETGVKDDFNGAYLKILAVTSKKGLLTAKLEMDIHGPNGTWRGSATVKKGDDLERKSRGVAAYEDNYVVESIDATPGQEQVAFCNGRVLKMSNGVSDILRKEQLRQTIETHFERARALRPKGIKVLSLVFIDKVANYRMYDAAGACGKGRFAEWFEELWAKEAAKPVNRALYEGDVPKPEEVHDGYFSIDKAKRLVDTAENNEANRAAAERGFQLIMKNKTLLLSFSSKVEFVFSHSALREGWDNPNVFQICTLNEMASDMRRRQMIGRGLRICVNQEGERVRDEGVNVLTVMANESFASFAEGLQREIEEETGFKFGVFTRETFAHIVREGEHGEIIPLGAQGSGMAFDFLKTSGYLGSQDRGTDEFKKALKRKAINWPPPVSTFGEPIEALCAKIMGGLNVKPKQRRRKARRNEQLYAEFKVLWDRIKYRTRFEVKIDTDRLIGKCVETMKDRSQFRVIRPQVVVNKTRMVGSEHGLSAGASVQTRGTRLDTEFEIPDVLARLQNETNLTRRTLATILLDSGRIGDIGKNPQMFLDGAVRIIRDTMAGLIVDGIKYEKYPDDVSWTQRLFNADELFGSVDDGLKENMVETKKRGLYDFVICDSEIEKDFAEKLDGASNVKVFAKLPPRFQISTPLGNYNPDWAVVLDEHGTTRFYFIVETKGTDKKDRLTSVERAKIDCGTAHFKALGIGVDSGDSDYFAPVKDWDGFMELVSAKVDGTC